ncbi:annexin A13 [Brachionus plicatilis]|uniref:Annexin n=1 Tax=Brachionus plicatilis TaxID=10195 RepID=A0A3M7QZF6_BRAPC|nr:annexin A13 [Brachionus plicatilis]
MKNLFFRPNTWLKMETDSERCEKEQAQMEKVALSFEKAMKGIGTDENRIIREVVAYNNRQRQLIKSKYLVLTGKEIEEDFKSEIGGFFLEAVLALFMPVDDYEASILHQAFQGMGTNEQKIIEILCTKNAEEIREVKNAYRKMYRTELEADLKNEEGGDLGRLFRSLASGGRRENHGYDKEFIEKETQNLYDAGEGKTGTDEKEFVRILSSRSFAELNAIFALYKESFENDLEQAIKDEFSGDLCEALLTIVKCVRNRPRYFAEFLGRSVQEKKNFEQDLLQVVIRRAEIDLPEINDEFKKMYGRSLTDLVHKQADGDFKKLMVALMKKI